MESSLTVAIQGGKASFHDMAARQYFYDHQIELRECHTFREMCRSLLNGEAGIAVMAIENTLVGSILPNYALLQEYPLSIVGEVYLHIEQHLMALPGQTLKDIRAVRSHPMALLQCSDFLEMHPQMRGIESFDTADSAREIRERHLRTVAAIAGEAAAQRYGLQILARSIENLKQNYTRFLVISCREEPDKEPLDKASVNFRVNHRVGALAKVLNIFQEYEINLTKIQSIPLPGRPYEYAFLVELEWERRELFDRAIHLATRFSRGLKILGIYQKGVKPYDYTGSKTA